MPTKPPSVKSSRTSTAAAKLRRRSRVAREIIAGLEEARAYLKGDLALRTRAVHVPNPIDVHAIRIQAGFPQAEFARRFGFNRRTLQEWEQGRAQPDAAVRAYLTVIARDQAAVEKALAGELVPLAAHSGAMKR